MIEGLGLSPAGMAFAAGVLLAAGFVRGFSGFGLSAVVVAGIALVAAPAVAVPLAIVLEVAASLFQARSVRREIAWREVLALFAGGVVGNPIGILLLETVAPSRLKIAVYGCILLASILLLLARSQPKTLSAATWLAVGVAAGIVNGATALAGLLIVTVMTLTATPAARMRATLVAYFLLSNGYAVALLAWRGLIDRALVELVVLALPLVAIGIVAGSLRFLDTTDAVPPPHADAARGPVHHRPRAGADRCLIAVRRSASTACTSTDRQPLRSLAAQLRPPARTAPSDANQLDVATEERPERLDVVEVRRDDVVAVAGQQHERGVDHVARACAFEQRTGGAAEVGIDGAHVDTGQSFGQQGLPRAATAPGLPDDAAVRNGDAPRVQRGLESAPHGAIVLLERDERSTVENQRHRAEPVRRALRFARVAFLPRTTTAASRSARA